MQILVAITNWVLLWFSGWYGWVLLCRRGCDLIKTYRTAIVYFSFLILLSFLLYHTYLYTFFSHIPFKSTRFYTLGIFWGGIFGAYAFAQNVCNKDILSDHQKQKVFAAAMSYHYILSKSFDILFQQILFLSLVLTLKQAFTSHMVIILLSGCIFCLVHFPLLFIWRTSLTVYFIIASFFAGIIFSLLISLFPYGFVYSYMVHWSFYVFIGIIYNIRFGRKYRASSLFSLLFQVYLKSIPAS